MSDAQRTPEEEEMLKRFGERLRSLRKEKGFTQEDLAEKAGFTRSYYTEIERGKRNVSLLNITKLAVCLGVSLTELLDFYAPPKN
jgi:transcriptional regulator with XRE-family HTH domain